MSISIDKTRSDFDSIARLTEGEIAHPVPYEAFLLRLVPRRCARALDIGCGTGAFSRALATRAGQVVGIDLSPEMVRIARDQNGRRDNVEYFCGDLFSLPLAVGSFGCVASLTTLHHLRLEAGIERMTALLKPGGTLLIHDMRADAGLRDRIHSVLGLGVSALLRLRRTGRLRDPRELREAWREHGMGERYLTMADVGQMCRTLLPGADSYRHLLWRYTAVWVKPGAV